MYFRGSGSDGNGLGDAVFSTRDGVNIELTDTVPTDDTDFKEAKVVPGVATQDMGNGDGVLWTGVLDYKGENGSQLIENFVFG